MTTTWTRQVTRGKIHGWRGCLIKHFFMKSPLLSTFLLCLMSASCSAAQHFYSCSTLVTTVWYRQWNIFARIVKYFCADRQIFLLGGPTVVVIWCLEMRWEPGALLTSPQENSPIWNGDTMSIWYGGVRFGSGRRVNRSSDCVTVLWQCCGWRTDAPVAKSHQWSNCLHLFSSVLKATVILTHSWPWCRSSCC